MLQMQLVLYAQLFQIFFLISTGLLIRQIISLFTVSFFSLQLFPSVAYASTMQLLFF